MPLSQPCPPIPFPQPCHPLPLPQSILHLQHPYIVPLKYLTHDSSCPTLPYTLPCPCQLTLFALAGFDLLNHAVIFGNEIIYHIPIRTCSCTYLCASGRGGWNGWVVVVCRWFWGTTSPPHCHHNDDDDAQTHSAFCLGETQQHCLQTLTKCINGSEGK